MNNQIPKGFKSIFSDFKHYLDIRIELIRLNAIEKGAKLVADLLSNAIVLFFLIIAFLASGFARFLFVKPITQLCERIRFHSLIFYAFSVSCALEKGCA